MTISEKEYHWEKILRVAGFGMIGVGISVRIVAYLINRSLWGDEAMLASSVINRNLLELCYPLDFTQGAPVGFLWLTKMFTSLLGTSEYVLRLPSLLAGLGAIAFFYFILKNVFKDPRPYVGTAFFATIPFLIHYSIEFKPYMMDGFLSLALLYLFHLVNEKRIGSWLFTVVSAASVWFSLPAIFTVTALFCIWVMQSLLQGQHTMAVKRIVLSFIPAISFLAFYFTIYHNLDTNLSLGFWELLTFPLLPQSLDDLKLIALMARNYLEGFDYAAKAVVAIVSVLGVLLVSDKEKRPFVVFIFFEGLLILVASWLGKMPILNRILLFCIPLHMLFVVLTWNDLSRKFKRLGLFLPFILITVNIASVRFFLPEHVYRPRQEVSPIIEKLESSRRELPVYVYASAIPQYEYKTGYHGRLRDKPLLEPIIRNNVIYGSQYYPRLFEKPYSWDAVTDTQKLALNVDAIAAHDTVFLLIANSFEIPPFLDALRKSGAVNEMMNTYDTPMYLYVRKQLIDSGSKQKK